MTISKCLLYSVLATALSLLWLTPINGQLSESAEVSLLTCARGDDIWNMYGHSAIRIYDPAVNMDQVYNFGIFDFREPNFIMKFLRGKLLYRVEKQRTANFLQGYIYEKRSVTKQVLNIDPYDASKLYQALELNCKPENKHYLYDFFFDNCTSRLRDLLENEILGFQFPEQPLEELTYRGLLDKYTYAWPWTDFGQDLIVGSVADADAQLRGQCFLPEFLQELLSRSSIGHLPAVKETEILLDYSAEEAARSQKPTNWPIILFGLLLLIELVLFIKMPHSQWVKWTDKLWYFLLGLGGLIIAFMWFGTDHLATKKNLNLLWMSPLFLLMFKWSNKGLIIILAAFSILSLILSLWLQSFHPCTVIVIVITLLKLARALRSDFSDIRS